MKYLFNQIGRVLEKIKRAEGLFIFLDFDGTLTPIVSHPEKAYLSKEMKRLLSNLKRNPKVQLAIVSGRSLEDIRNRVGLKDIYYIGNHGLEIFEPQKGIRESFRKEVVPELKRIRDRLKDRFGSLEGIVIEDKGCILAINYRNVNPKWAASTLMTIKEEIKNSILSLCLGFGKFVFEVRPNSPVNKGIAVLELFGQVNQDGTLPFYIGDDQTDEDAFRALKKMGITIFVGLSGNSSAQYYVKDPSEVFQFLKAIKEGFV